MSAFVRQKIKLSSADQVTFHGPPALEEQTNLCFSATGYKNTQFERQPNLVGSFSCLTCSQLASCRVTSMFQMTMLPSELQEMS